MSFSRDRGLEGVEYIPTGNPQESEHGLSFKGEISKAEGKDIIDNFNKPSASSAAGSTAQDDTQVEDEDYPDVSHSKRGRARAGGNRGKNTGTVDPELKKRKLEAANERKHNPQEKIKTWLRGVNSDICAVRSALKQTEAEDENVPASLKTEYSKILGDILKNVTDRLLIERVHALTLATLVSCSCALL